jgi:hypothetical protein
MEIDQNKAAMKKGTGNDVGNPANDFLQILEDAESDESARKKVEKKKIKKKKKKKKGEKPPMKEKKEGSIDSKETCLPLLVSGDYSVVVTVEIGNGISVESSEKMEMVEKEECIVNSNSDIKQITKSVNQTEKVSFQAEKVCNRKELEKASSGRDGRKKKKKATQKKKKKKIIGTGISSTSKN